LTFGGMAIVLELSIGGVYALLEITLLEFWIWRIIDCAKH